MKDIAIYGGGGFGKEVACLINQINQINPTWNLIGFFDDGITIETEISHFGKVLGNIDTLNSWNKELAVAFAIGNTSITKNIIDKIENPNIIYPNLIHPNFFISDKESFKIGNGNIIQGSCVVTCDVEIKDFNILNGYICFGHDVKVGSFNTFMPSTRISGEVKIGDQNFFGVGSIVLQQIKIGNNIKIGAGAVLMTKPKENSLYLGNPAKIFKF